MLKEPMPTDATQILLLAGHIRSYQEVKKLKEAPLMSHPLVQADLEPVMSYYQGFLDRHGVTGYNKTPSGA